MKSIESALAYFYYEGEGFKIDCMTYNSLGLNIKNFDFTKNYTIFKEKDLKQCGEYLQANIESHQATKYLIRTIR